MPKTLKQHSMEYTTAVGKTAVSLTRHFLTHHWVDYTVSVHSVEDDPAYQQHDIDLLWSIVDGNGRLRIIPLEIKGDKNHHTGNFFFETVSNMSKGTAGCILYTKAHWIFYVFVEIEEIYCLPMDVVYPWFTEHLEAFRVVETSTPVGKGENYVTNGRLVPITTLLEEVEGIRHYQKTNDIWVQKSPSHE
ncbi:MAG: hypothetical protein IAF02_18470 [Anaerolineae bacterium]|nr:hypothetical protein [Anaerolineae bacterium]